MGVRLEPLKDLPKEAAMTFKHLKAGKIIRQSMGEQMRGKRYQIITLDGKGWRQTIKSTTLHCLRKRGLVTRRNIPPWLWGYDYCLWKIADSYKNGVR